MDGGETAMFKQYFVTWKESMDCEDNGHNVGLGRVYPKETIAEWDVASLHSDNRRRSDSRKKHKILSFLFIIFCI